jgi:outer membrane protein insertion porin family
MMRKISGMLVVVLIAVSAIGGAAQYPLTISDLSIEGNSEIRLRDILEVVEFEIGDAIEEADLRAASQAIYDLGWFEEVALDRDALENAIVIFQVVENPIVRDIVIEGNINRRDYQLFGIKLFDAPLVSSSKIRSILRSNDVRKRDVLNRNDLMHALEEIIEEYSDLGYVLVSIGDVGLTETLSIEIVEQTLAGNLIEGLSSVPASVAEEMIEIPIGEPLKLADFQGSYATLNQSIYFSSVAVEPQMGISRDEAWLRWILTERTLLDEPTTISSLSIEGNTIYPDDVLGEFLGALPNRQVNNYEFLEIVKGVFDQYIEDGYSLIELSVAAIENGHVRLKVAEGVLTQITVQGNTRTHDYVIERNSELVIGKVLNREDVLVSYQQLNSLGYFGSVDIIPEWVDGGVEVTISVTEKSNLGGFGGSVAIDPSSGELFGELTLSEKNIFGTGQDVAISYSRTLLGTAESSPSTWNIGYGTVARFPGFDRVSVDLYQQTGEVVVDELSTVEITLGAEVSFSYPVADYTSFNLAISHEEDHLIDNSAWTPTDKISLTLAYDNTDDPAFPIEGGRRRLTLIKAGGFSAGREYTQVGFSWIHFTPVKLALIGAGLDQTVAIRINAGLGDSGVPTSQQMTLGGAASIRGVEGITVSQYVLGNAEYRVELVDGLNVTAFLDVGFDLEAVRFQDIQSSFGFELGIAAAGITVRLDLAWILNDEFSWQPVFDFGFGQMF